jgi:superfamily II DNA or RNA helicase
MYLAGRCNYARTNDGVGFNKIDADFGHRLADKPFATWTPRERYGAYRMLGKYKNTQLADFWSLIPAQPEPETVKPFGQPTELNQPRLQNGVVPVTRTLRVEEYDGQPHASLEAPFDDALVRDIRALPARFWDKVQRRWYIPLANLNGVEPLLDLAATWSFEMHPSVQAKIEAAITIARKRLLTSNAADTEHELNIVGLGGELRPFQRAGVLYAIDTPRVLIADQMGLGKTVQALALALATDAFPCIVISPAVVKYKWLKEVKRWCPGKKVDVCAGHLRHLVNFDNSPSSDIVIINYDIIDKWRDQLAQLNPKLVVIDESHYVKNPERKRTKAVMRLCGLGDEVEPAIAHPARVCLLTGTAIENRPEEFWTSIKLLKLERHFGSYTRYKALYCGDKPTYNMVELNHKMRSLAMVRRLKKDVLKELPPKQVVTVPLGMSDEWRRKYRETEADVAGFFATKAARDAEAMALDYAEAIIADLSPADMGEFLERRQKERFTGKYLMAARAEALLRWEALKQVCVKAKTDALYAWIDDFLESGEPLVVFGLHRDDIRKLHARYEQSHGALLIDGDVDPQERQRIAELFQTSNDHQVLVANQLAGGVGIDLYKASDVVHMEFGWNPSKHAQAEDRCHRIGQTDSVTVWWLVAESTIDEEIVQLIEDKRKVVDAVLDGHLDFDVVEVNMMEELESRLKARVADAPKARLW